MTLHTTSGVIPPARISKRTRNIPNGTVIARNSSGSRFWIWLDGDIVTMSRSEWRDFCHSLDVGREIVRTP